MDPLPLPSVAQLNVHQRAAFGTPLATVCSNRKERVTWAQELINAFEEWYEGGDDPFLPGAVRSVAVNNNQLLKAEIMKTSFDVWRKEKVYGGENNPSLTGAARIAAENEYELFMTTLRQHSEKVSRIITIWCAIE